MYVVRTSPRHAGHGALRNHLCARILDCRAFQRDAATLEERERWLAEEAGLTDALLGIDRTAEPQAHGSPAQRERYAVGLHDGRTILRASEDVDRDVTEEDIDGAGNGTGLNRPEPRTRANNFSTPPGKESERYA